MMLFQLLIKLFLVEFARAGLHDPRLIRLDTESKISPDLHSAFFTMKSAEKEGALMQILSVGHRLTTLGRRKQSDLRMQNRISSKFQQARPRPQFEQKKKAVRAKRGSAERFIVRSGMSPLRSIRLSSLQLPSIM